MNAPEIIGDNILPKAPQAQLLGGLHGVAADGCRGLECFG